MKWHIQTFGSKWLSWILYREHETNDFDWSNVMLVGYQESLFATVKWRKWSCSAMWASSVSCWRLHLAGSQIKNWLTKRERVDWLSSSHCPRQGLSLTVSTHVLPVMINTSQSTNEWRNVKVVSLFMEAWSLGLVVQNSLSSSFQQ